MVKFEAGIDKHEVKRQRLKTYIGKSVAVWVKSGIFYDLMPFF